MTGLRLVILLALAWGGTGLPAQADDGLRPVVSEIVATNTLPQRSFTGQIEAQQSAVLAFQTSGRLATLPWTVGDRVRKGQVLAVLDQVSLAEDVAASQAAETSAMANFAAASQTLARAKALNLRGVLANDALDAAQRSNDTAAAQATAAVANLRRAKDAAGFGTLLAPDSGVVLAIAAKPGTVVSPGTPVLTLALGQGREAVLDMPADYLSLLSPGRSFLLRCRTPGTKPLIGQLRLVEPVADAATRSRRIRVTLPQAPDAWKIGALVRAELAGDSQPVITLPLSAVTGPPQAEQVWIVAPGRMAHLVPVVLGAELGDRVVVLQGLTIGTEVVVKGVHSLTEGEKLGDREP